MLITRAVRQAEAFGRLLNDAGARAIILPAISITALTPPVPSNAPDWVIFISPNAVQHGLDLVQPLLGGATRVAAIGPATARVLETAGVHQVLRPQGGFDSESMLRLDTFNAMQGQSVLIVRGVGGRALLIDTLRERGAAVSVLQVYTRSRPTLSNEQVQYLETRWAQGAVSVTTCLSVETLDNLMAILTSRGQRMFAVTPLLSASARVLARAETLGHKAHRELASGPMSEDLLNCLEQMAENGLI